MSDHHADDATYREVVAGLLEDGEQFAKSRLKLYRAVVLYRVAQARKAAALMVVALMIAAAALVALLMALVLALSEVMGPLVAGIVVCAIGLIVASLLILWGIRTFPNLDEKLFEDDEYDVAPSLAARDAADHAETTKDVR
ncbi:phage holin family protein [Parasphingopyxis sp.]|uniref:phage holin family protein n=1 Tax=Parasphingopyxis sp. TaxID=1920299 RepID=UPI00262750B6|nr:phage holin family protein [Parasphingopyxis sp.]